MTLTDALEIQKKSTLEGLRLGPPITYQIRPSARHVTHDAHQTRDQTLLYFTEISDYALSPALRSPPSAIHPPMSNVQPGLLAARSAGARWEASPGARGGVIIQYSL